MSWLPPESTTPSDTSSGSGDAPRLSEEIQQRIKTMTTAANICLGSQNTIAVRRVKMNYTLVSEDYRSVVGSLLENMIALRRNDTQRISARLNQLAAIIDKYNEGLLRYAPETKERRISDEQGNELEALRKERDAAVTERKSIISLYGPLLWKYQHPVLLLQRDPQSGLQLIEAGEGYQLQKDGNPLAHLTLRKYTITHVPGALRTVYCDEKASGSGAQRKEFVNDNLGTKTHRYAYVEKNIHQVRDFLVTGVMQGRFQQLLKACNIGPDKFAYLGKYIAAKSSANAQGASDAGLGIDACIRLALLHQYMGSGPQQRGLSMTSSSKPGVTFGNEGIPFKSADGVRIKVDLARVPPEILLLNHYGDQGVLDQAAASGYLSATGYHLLEMEQRLASVEFTGGGMVSSYEYMASVMKNRELYLEELKPEWIDAIDIHRKGQDDDVLECAGLPPDKIMSELGNRVCQADFILGVTEMLSLWQSNENEKVDVLLVSKTKPEGSRENDAFNAGARRCAAFIDGWNRWKGLAKEFPKQFATENEVHSFLHTVNTEAKATAPELKAKDKYPLVEKTFPSPNGPIKKMLTDRDAEPIGKTEFNVTKKVPGKIDMYWCGFARHIVGRHVQQLTMADLWPTEPQPIRMPVPTGERQATSASVVLHNVSVGPSAMPASAVQENPSVAVETPRQ